ncbi:type II secretion system protein, partial [bacterium]|nr:type II secretion system protein [bacterium]
TLAEVIITIGLVGVVALMVMPTLIVHVQKKILQLQSEHCYTSLSGTFKHYLADNGVDVLSGTPIYSNGTEYSGPEFERALDAMDKFIRGYTKVISFCTYEERSKCFPDRIFSLDGRRNVQYEIQPFALNYVLINGYSISVYPPTQYYPGGLSVDVNGRKGPNVGGRDIWYLSIYNDGTLNEPGLTPECLKDSDACARQGSSGNTVREIIDNQFAKCTTQGELNPYGAGCFGHFKEAGYVFDY